MLLWPVCWFLFQTLPFSTYSTVLYDIQMCIEYYSSSQVILYKMATCKHSVQYKHFRHKVHKKIKRFALTNLQHKHKQSISICILFGSVLLPVTSTPLFKKMTRNDPIQAAQAVLHQQPNNFVDDFQKQIPFIRVIKILLLKLFVFHICRIKTTGYRIIIEAD